MIEVLKETDFTFLGEKKTGKVRDIYIQPDPSSPSGQGRLVLISTDRHSSFDRIIAHIPWKGQGLNQISAWWFEQTKTIVPNHVLAVPDPNVMVGKKMKMVPVEAVMRGYLTGVTDTAIWTRYQKGERTFGGVTLPEQMIAEGLITKELFDEVRETATKLFSRGQEIAAKRGLILVDTKYEFGTDEKRNLVLIDEIHTPASSRFWQMEGYEEAMAKGEQPKSFDKEFLRLWFKENCDPYKDVTLPDAPPELVEELSRRYIQMYEQLTGKKFVHGETPVIPRIERNLKPYAI